MKTIISSTVQTTEAPRFSRVNYEQFRELLSRQEPQAIKNKGKDTLLLGARRKVQAIIKAATIDAQGHCFPTTYFVSNELIVPQALTA